MKPDSQKESSESENCHACRKSLHLSQYSISIPSTGNSFHRDCFVCEGCSKVFASEGDGRAFVSVGEEVYHPKVSRFPSPIRL